MDTPYDFKDWEARARRGRGVFNFNYRMLGREVRGFALLKAVLMEARSDAEENVYLWAGTDDPAQRMVRVTIAEMHHWRQAQQRLRVELEHSMRPQIPRATGPLAHVGNVALVAREPDLDLPLAILFTRGNLFVSVNSAGDRAVDVTEFARRIDHALSAPVKARVEPGWTTVRPPAPPARQSGGSRVLVRDLKVVRRRDAWLKVVAPEGEVARHGDSLVHVMPEKASEQAPSVH